MPAKLSTSHDFIQNRSEITRAVQVNLADEPGWVWPLKSVDSWDADLVSLDASAGGSLRKETTQKHTKMLGARGLLDARFEAIHEFTLLAVGVMRVRAKPLPGMLRVVNDLSARGDSRRAIEDEAEDLLVAWEEWESETGAAFSPAPGKSLGDFKLLLEGAPGGAEPANPSVAALKKSYRTALAKWRCNLGLLDALYARLEDECIGWYAEATNVFMASTTVGDMIRSLVPTDYTPPKAVPTGRS